MEDLKALIDRLPVMAYRCLQQPDRTMVYLSRGCEQLCGYAPDDFDSSGTSWGALTHKDDCDEVWHHIEQAIAGDGEYRVEYRIVTRTGKVRWVSDYGRPFPGDKAYLEGFIVDTTANKQMRKALDDEHAYAEAVVETAVEAIISIDTNGRIETFNDAAQRMFGHSLDEVYGRNVRMLMPEPFSREHDGYLKRYLATNVAHIIGIGREVSGLRKDGTVFPIHLSIGEEEHSAKRRFVGLIRDISRQHDAEQEARQHREQLAHLDRLNLLGEMATGIAHEINQPLTSISLFAQAAKRLLDAGNHDKLAETCDKISQQARRAGAVVERVQAMARKQDSSKQIVDCNALVREVSKLAETEALIHNISIRLEIGEKIPKVEVDPVQFQQVALNLVRNGMEAMRASDGGKGNSIQICTRTTPAGDVEVAVIDSGCGVSEDVSEKLFTPFSSSKESGLGMGLFICRAIISAHGGELGYRDNPDLGATFYFTLPPAKRGA